MDVPPWTFPPLHICLFLSKLVKASHSPTESECSALEHERVQASSVPIYTDGPMSSEGVSCAAVFPDFDVVISLPVVASIFTAELCGIFLFLLTFPSMSVVIYSDLLRALQALGSLYTRNPLLLKISVSFVSFTSAEDFSPSAGSL